MIASRRNWRARASSAPPSASGVEFVLEGGGIESDGAGTLLTTSACLLSPGRNPAFSRAAIEQRLGELFGLQRVLWLEHGALEGDDTDSHIDTLARFCDERTIAYVRCTDRDDAHFAGLERDGARTARAARRARRALPPGAAAVARGEARRATGGACRRPTPTS